MAVTGWLSEVIGHGVVKVVQLTGKMLFGAHEMEVHES